jgi:hypothetical protein
MIRLREPYRPRPVRCLEVWEHGGWRLKVYGIAYGRPAPRPALVGAAKEIAARVLPRPAVTEGRYGAGFLGVHDGRGAAFVFVCWWSDENELHHVVHAGPADDPRRLAEQPSGGTKACVWDLAVIGFERQAWVETVLKNPAGPDLDAYLARRLDAEV